MSVIWQNNEWYGQGGDVTGRAKSTAIAPVFDETATYAAGDRVTYEDELYVFNTAHTGAWAAADADKTDVDTLTERMPATDMSEVASPMPSVMSRLPVLFDESGTEQVVGWYKLANGTKKPLYQKTIIKTNFAINNNASFVHDIQNVESIFIKEGFLNDNGNIILLPMIWTDTFDGVYVNTTQISFKGTGIWAASAGRTLYITVQYTKTTDTPQ